VRDIVMSDTCCAALVAAPSEIQKLFGKQIAHLLDNPRHPSLQAKKFDGARWQARINDDWRLYYRPNGKTLILLDLIPHPK
jgi:hypothetical protein